MEDVSALPDEDAHSSTQLEEDDAYAGAYGNVVGTRLRFSDAAENPEQRCVLDSGLQKKMHETSPTPGTIADFRRGSDYNRDIRKLRETDAGLSLLKISAGEDTRVRSGN